jgi:hypothetical protein
MFDGSNHCNIYRVSRHIICYINIFIIESRKISVTDA